MRVLVTRPKDDARKMMARLEALGCEAMSAPLIDIAFEPIHAAALDGAAGLIATSRNAIAALEASDGRQYAKNLPIFTVGAATAKRARQAGLTNVIEGPGTAAELAPVIVAHSAAKRGPLIHLAGNHLAFDLAGTLSRLGVTVRTLLVYQSIAARRLPADVESALAARALDAVILMSPRTAKTWSKLSERYDLSNVTHLCLSNAVETVLARAGRPPLKTSVAARPMIEDVLALVLALAPQSGAE